MIEMALWPSIAVDAIDSDATEIEKDFSLRSK
jgi:hypothetical protein